MITEVAITTEAAIESGLFTEISSFFSGFDGIKNFILSLSGVTLMALIYKVRGLLNIIKQPGFEKTLFNLGEKFIADATKKPELVAELSKVLQDTPQFQTLMLKATEAKTELLLELEGRIFDIEAKIKSGMFNDAELAKLVEYKAKLIEHVENVK